MSERNVDLQHRHDGTTGLRQALSDRRDSPKTPAVSEPVFLAPGHDASRQRSVTKLDRWLARRVLYAVGNLPIAMVLWNSDIVVPDGTSPRFRMVFADRKTLFQLALDPELQFGELYSSGRLRIEGDVAELAELATRSCQETRSPRFRFSIRNFLRRWRTNTLSRSRDNVYHHYDIGNEFYKLWLDEQMLYTCAYFPTPDVSLEEAQVAKMHHVCRKVCLRPGDTVVEAGCGWGALALHMARYYGVNVKAFNVSHEQIVYARERARAEGLDDRVEFIEEDWRKIMGTFDAFVSVGMLEHVGPENYRQLGDVIHKALSPRGLALLHSIGRNVARPLNAWINDRIFPGAYPPSLREIADILEGWKFSVLDVENLRLHYARTLEHWLERFEDHVEFIRDQFDESFIRTWRLYLASSIGAFRGGGLQLFQIVFTHTQNNNIPWTRTYLYDA